MGGFKIVLKIIARNNPARLPILYGTRIMEISALSCAVSWYWCLGSLNPANLLTRSGCTLKKIDCTFWLQGSFLPQPPSSLPTKPCGSLISSQTLSASSKKVSTTPPNPLTECITELLTNNQSYFKILRSFCTLLQIGRTYSEPQTSFSHGPKCTRL